MCAIQIVLLLAAVVVPDRIPTTPLPAYAHNDYLNAKPLVGALELGFRGVEVDYFVVEGELRVGHELDKTQPGRTVESMYLEPIREYVRRHGHVYPDAALILNIESKEKGIETYDALHELLARYEDILTVVRNGVEDPGPVQVILVGWRPSLDELLAQPLRYVAVQEHMDTLPEDHARYPSHLLKLLSQNYKQKLIARGIGPVSKRMRRRIDRLVDAAAMVPGRMVRVYGVPTNGSVYDGLLGAGVDLIGTRDIEGAHRILTGTPSTADSSHKD
jgi:hypothetical protein